MGSYEPIVHKEMDQAMNKEYSVTRMEIVPMITPQIPVLLESWKMLRDDDSHQTALCYKFINIFPGTLISFVISLECKTKKNKKLPVLYWTYHNIYCLQNMSFGEDITIVLPYPEIRNVKVKIIDAVYDRTIFRNTTGNEFQKIRKPRLLSQNGISSTYDKLNQKIDFRPEIPFVYKPVITSDYWICRCGTVNSSDSYFCRMCLNSIEYSDTDNFDKDKLEFSSLLSKWLQSPWIMNGLRALRYVALLALIIFLVFLARDIVSKSNNSSNITRSSSSTSTSYNRKSYTPRSRPSTAYDKAQSYISHMAFSREGLIDQLEYEGYSRREAETAVDLCFIDWEDQALAKALGYLDHMAFSKQGLLDQLEYEGFTHQEASYAVNRCGADWNEQAAKKADEYRKIFDFSYSEMVRQLEHEDFTHSQAVYGASH